MNDTPSGPQEGQTPEPQAPPPAAPQAPAPVAAPVAAPVQAVTAACRSGAIWPFLAMGGAALMLISFFLPWWSIDLSEGKRPKRGELTDEAARKRYENDLKAYQADVEAAGEAMQDGTDFYRDAISKSAWRGLNKKGGGSASAFGWNVGSGITAFIFSLLVLPMLIVPMFVPILKKWSWAMAMPAAVMGLIAFILAFVFWLSSPGENVSGLVEQGVSVGPFIALVGGLAVAGGAGLAGVCGLMGFIKGAKTA